MRDRRLDFWRGVCLVDMVLVHLVHEGIQFGPLTALIVDYTRFAAGGFVFVAGLGIGLVFLPRIAETGIASVLQRRALYLLGVHYALTGGTVVVDVVTGRRLPVEDPLRLVRDVVLLREAPAYIDVLPLYVAMLLVTPPLLARIRRAPWSVAGTSLGLFAYGCHQPTALSPPANAQFPFLLWQAFYVAGLLFGTIVPHLDRSRRGWAAAGSLAALVFAVLTVLAYGPCFGLFGVPSFVRFSKVPLTTAEYLRYLATTLVVISATALAWRRLDGSAAARFVGTLGRRSLAMYGAHVFVQALALLVAAPVWWLGGLQAVVVVPTLALLWSFARGLDAWDAVTGRFRATRGIVRGWAAPPLGIVAAAVLVASVRHPGIPVDLPGADLVDSVLVNVTVPDRSDGATDADDEPACRTASRPCVKPIDDDRDR